MEGLPTQARRIVVKLGTGVLTQGIGKLDTQRIHDLCGQLAALRRRGLEVVIVSSGAVGLGMGRLQLERRPKRLAALQKCAAVGQSILINTWQAGLDPHGLTAAQMLLTREDVKSRTRHLAVKDLLGELLDSGLVPVVNGNDSVSTEEIKFGDNDVLSAMVASLTHADLLAILSTAPGLIDREGSGEVVPLVETITPEIEAMAGGTADATAVGGMVTKIEAARIATASGCGVFIGSGREPEVLQRIVEGPAPGTFFLPRKLPLDSRKRWIAFFQPPSGTLHVDAGAVQALQEKGSSLLAKGIRSVDGHFGEEAVVEIAGPDRQAFARGISGFSSEDVSKILGQGNDAIRASFPRRKRCEVVHRDALVLLRDRA
ncbi:MAG: glutamate 5-kinase [Opitutales bacterium]